MFQVLTIISACFVWVLYHKIFAVIYFDLSKGCIAEIIVSILGGIVIAYLILNYWFIAIPLILLMIYGMVKK